MHVWDNSWRVRKVFLLHHSFEVVEDDKLQLQLECVDEGVKYRLQSEVLAIIERNDDDVAHDNDNLYQDQQGYSLSHALMKRYMSLRKRRVNVHARDDDLLN